MELTRHLRIEQIIKYTLFEIFLNFAKCKFYIYLWGSLISFLERLASSLRLGNKKIHTCGTF